jgi:hypothetical protein
MQKTNKFFDLEEEASTKPPVNLNNLVSPGFQSAMPVASSSLVPDKSTPCIEESLCSAIGSKDNVTDDRIELIKIPSPTTQLRSQQNPVPISSSYKSAPVKPCPSQVKYNKRMPPVLPHKTNKIDLDIESVVQKQQNQTANPKNSN